LELLSLLFSEHLLWFSGFRIVEVLCFISSFLIKFSFLLANWLIKLLFQLSWFWLRILAFLNLRFKSIFFLWTSAIFELFWLI
jgi:hypothetical protein